MAYGHTNSKGNTYYLHSKGRMFFFSKEIKEGALDAVPEGYNVIEMKTGLPVLKKAAADAPASMNVPATEAVPSTEAPATEAVPATEAPAMEAVSATEAPTMETVPATGAVPAENAG